MMSAGGVFQQEAIEYFNACEAEGRLIPFNAPQAIASLRFTL